MKFKAIIGITAALLLSLFSQGVLADEGEGKCDKQTILNIFPPEVSGTANVCIVNRGVLANIRVGGLVPGNAYTSWWVYFDDTSLCLFGPDACGFAAEDFLGPDPISVIGRLGSTIAGEGGVALIHGDWRGMSPSSGSEIQLYVLDHGPADYTDGRRLARQTLTPEDPFFGTPHLGNDVDGWLGIPVGFTIHKTH